MRLAPPGGASHAVLEMLSMTMVRSTAGHLLRLPSAARRRR
jgi:hypothetical protein